MSSLFRPSCPADADELALFLKRMLSLPSPSPGFDAAGLNWKYWSPRNDWDGSRSYVLVGKTGIEAHCGLLPAWFSSPKGRIRAAHFIDWAANPRAFAAGVRILRKIVTLTDLTCAVGGSADTRKILPLMNFRPSNEAVFLARPLRPFRQAITNPQRNWKLPARLLRNVFWAGIRPPTPPADWSFESIAPDRVPPELWGLPASPRLAVRERASFVYAHYLSCPFTRFELFLVRHRQQPAGCFLIGFVSGQARVADVWLLHESLASYEAAYRLALAASWTDPTVAEVIACASIALRLDALKRCGFHEFRRESIMVFSAEKAPPDGFDCQLIDNDTAFLNFGATTYVT